MKIIIGKVASGKTRYVISQLDDAGHVYIYTKKPSDYNSLKNVNTITEFCEFKKLLDIHGNSFVFVVDELLTISIKDINEMLFNPHINKKDEYRFLPLQFYLQSIWFALSKQFDFLLQDEKHLHKIKNLDNLFSSLIEFKTQAEKLKMSLEHDIEVYRKVESRWNIESTFSHFVNKASLFESRQKNDIKLLKKALYTDTLTRAYTRNWLYDVVLSNGVFSECGALCVIDLDDFKIINDTLGHSTGDDVLKFFASVLLSSCQNTIRYGGDEFIVCYNSLHEAQRLVKLVRDEITGKDFITKEGRIIKLKFSCGFVGYSSGEAFEDVFTRADEKLYLDKEHKHTR